MFSARGVCEWGLWQGLEVLATLARARRRWLGVAEREGAVTGLASDAGVGERAGLFIKPGGVAGEAGELAAELLPVLLEDGRAERLAVSRDPPLVVGGL